jgi:predicted phosphate transport protein (TIGR00153 family)
VRLRLRPVNNTFYDLFARAAGNLVTGAGLLSELLAAGPPQRPQIAERMRVAEHEGDDITHAIMREVNSTFVTPFDREDIFQLASSLDDVMDHLDAAADFVVLYGLGDLPPDMTAQVAVLQRAAEVTADAMPRLRGVNGLDEYWIEINELENQADVIYRKLLAKLFDGECDALTVLKLKDVIEELEAAADAFEKVAHTVETVAVKES